MSTNVVPNNRDRIIEEAVSLFAQKGYHAVSVRDIAAKVGIRASTIYNYFSSKEELLDTIFDILDEQVGRQRFSLDSIEDGLSTMGLSEFLCHHGLKLQQTTTPLLQKIKRIIYMEQYRNERARSFVLDVIMDVPGKFYQKTFQRATEKGMIKTASPEMLALAFQYAMLTFSQEVMLRKVDGREVDSIYEQRKELVKFICGFVES